MAMVRIFNMAINPTKGNFTFERPSNRHRHAGVVSSIVGSIRAMLSLEYFAFFFG